MDSASFEHSVEARGGEFGVCEVEGIAGEAHFFAAFANAFDDFGGSSPYAFCGRSRNEAESGLVGDGAATVDAGHLRGHERIDGVVVFLSELADSLAGLLAYFGAVAEGPGYCHGGNAGDLGKVSHAYVGWQSGVVLFGHRVMRNISFSKLRSMGRL